MTTIDSARAIDELRSWPEHRETPLRELPLAAARAGVSGVWYKDESTRFGVGSFKAAGAAYAAHHAVAEARVAGRSAPVLCCASDGNHGRAVAWAARREGCDAVVYLPDHAREERARRIAALGATIVRIDGDYDEAVEQVRVDAQREGWLLVADTSADPDDVGVLRVMAGYGLIVDELVSQLEAMGKAPPTHAFLQAGVGTMAAAVAAELRRRLRDRTPRVVVVEPTSAPCVLRSLHAGTPTAVDGPLDTLMDCLAAGQVCAAAWPILAETVTHAIAIDDDECARVLDDARAGRFGPPLDAGPSGIAGLAGLLTMSVDARAAIGLDERSRVLVIGTEEGVR
ncbi:MAG TPA: diaminopropionate ammonia-lyase [Longimicrobiales bacterium]